MRRASTEPRAAVGYPSSRSAACAAAIGTTEQTLPAVRLHITATACRSMRAAPPSRPCMNFGTSLRAEAATSFASMSASFAPSVLAALLPHSVASAHARVRARVLTKAAGFARDRANLLCIETALRNLRHASLHRSRPLPEYSAPLSGAGEARHGACVAPALSATSSVLPTRNRRAGKAAVSLAADEQLLRDYMRRS